MTPKASRPKVAAIILDSTDAALIEKGIAEGWLPNLARFRQRGGYGRLQTGSEVINATAWPGFLTGQHAGDHGVWNYLAWAPHSMSHVPCTPEKQSLEPFWRDLCRRGHRCVALDVPRTYPPAEPFDGVEFSPWGAHYKLTEPYSHPADFLPWVNKTIGKEPLGNEPGGDLSASLLLAELDHVLRTTRMQGELGVRTLQREPCELFILAFSGPHRAGHVLWDSSGLAVEPTPEERRRIDNALRETYVETDRALGRVLDELGQGEDTTVLVFSLHGMGPNSSLADLLPDMLDCVLQETSTEPPQGGGAAAGGRLLHTLRDVIPPSFRHAVKNSLPKSLQHRLTVFWRQEDIDWSQTQAVALIPDLQGFIRVNLKGRESQGIVEPGAPYDEICARIMDGLMTFKHSDTGEPAVVDVQRADALFPGGERLSELPDLIVQWSDRPAKDTVGVTSERYRTIAWPTPGRVPDGRSGHHRHRAWLAAVGAGIEAHSELPLRHALDLPPTLYALLGARPPQRMAGSPIEALFPWTFGAKTARSDVQL
jgi:predicted AlkP superfamily phosphohydrolase/phosphomutase